MEGIQVDWLSVVIAAVLNMAIGFFWYSKWLFKSTRESLGRETERKASSIHVLYQFVVSLAIAFFLSFFEGYLGVTSVSDGMFVGFCLWLGFVATTQISPYIWYRRSLKLFLIDTSYKLLTFLVMSGVIGA